MLQVDVQLTTLIRDSPGTDDLKVKAGTLQNTGGGTGFKLGINRETRELPTHALLLAKGGLAHVLHPWMEYLPRLLSR
jgi:hypothetical protein